MLWDVECLLATLLAVELLHILHFSELKLSSVIRKQLVYLSAVKEIMVEAFLEINF